MALLKEHLNVPFVTTHEFDRALGGGARGRKQRRRLTIDRAILPEPRSFGRIKRQNLLVFPRFAFGGLLKTLGGGGDPNAMRAIIQTALVALHEPCFEDLGAAAVESGRTRLDDGWNFAVVVRGVSELAPETMKRCAILAAEMEAELERGTGLTFQADIATLDHHDNGDAVLLLADGGRGRVKRESVLIDEDKVFVVHEHLSWLGNTMELVKPIAFPIGTADYNALLDRHDVELAEWFGERVTSSVAGVVVDNGERDAPPEELVVPRWERKRYSSAPSHMTRVPRAT